ncbi:hypothetical protein LguiB_010971 [Lonicera macranthoides]
MGWSLRSSVDGSGLNPASPINKSRSRTRLIRALQSFQIKVNARIEAIRKDFPTKLLFFLVGFYCSTAFATIIGQTGDWDILAAALAMAVVEGIGFLTYKASLPLFDKARNLISMFNYWKAGLSLGLFLDSFNFSQVLGCQIYFDREFADPVLPASAKIALKGNPLVDCDFLE